MHKISLKIADIVIQMKSRFPLEKLSKEEQGQQAAERFKNFHYKGRQKPHIRIDIEIVDNLPEAPKADPVFITYHFQDGSENWRLQKRGKTFIYKSPLKGKKQLMLVSKNFSRVKAYLLPKDKKVVLGKDNNGFVKKNKGFTWNTSDIIYDFLQVLLINYFAVRNEGIFTHAVGIKDLDGKGLLFCGKSEAGKSTTARIWHRHSKAMVLNDDRIIVRKIKRKFLIYGCPWHGDFNDYLISRIESAPLGKLFFIHHAPRNTVRDISQKKAFKLLYPALFPTFWDKRCLENIVSFCHDLIATAACYNLGFVNDKRVIKFVRKVGMNGR